MFEGYADQIQIMEENIRTFKKEINAAANIALSKEITIERLKNMHWVFCSAFDTHVFFRADSDESRDILKIAREAYAAIGYGFRPKVIIPELKSKIQFEDGYLQLCFNYTELKEILNNEVLNLPTDKLRLSIKDLITEYGDKIKNLQSKIKEHNDKINNFVNVLNLL